MTNSKEIAKKIIAENTYCTIATSSKAAEPWISPMRFYYDEKYTIYWISEKCAKHSNLIVENSRVAIAIFDSGVPEGEGNGVYMVAQASEVPGSELPHALDVIYAQKEKRRTSEYFQGDSPRRIYKAVPENVWILADPMDVKGHLVDRRIEVNLL